MSACAALSPDSFAAAVPEVIELTDDERAGPAGAALDHEQTKFRSLLSEGEYDAALESAKLAVALTSQVWGTESNQLGQALTNLAIAQTEVNNFPAAQQNFEAAIRVYEQAERSLVSSELINPLRGLADTQIAMSQYEAAIPLFERAIHISHVTDGPTNLQQIQDMDALSRAHFFSGSAARATSIQEKMYRLQQRKFSANSEGYAEALDRRANWFTEIGDFTQATYTLRRLERVLGETYGRDDPRLIPVLIRLSFVANKQADGPTTLTPEIAEKEARRAINRAVRIARTQAEDNPQLLARTLTQRGDFL
ncbi:MAG: tetratricopeptide repeat protein, partial [Pseudomonadota bacterium]